MIRLLVITQKVDQSDPVLGFFHRWLEVLATRCDELSVICLEAGAHHLPPQVKVYSLGKEVGRSRWKYLLRLAAYLWKLRSAYTTVFVHMNQEYVLLAGWWWRLTGKQILLWRNHPRGTWLTRWAVRVANRVFCTSPFSYTARFAKTEVMPVGIDTDFFKPSSTVRRQPGSILSLGRVAPIKNIDLVLEAVATLVAEGLPCQLTLVGRAKEAAEIRYQTILEEQISAAQLRERIVWLPSIAHHDTVRVYNEHEVFINLTPTGSMDKTIFEAMASGVLVLVSNQSLAGVIPDVCVATEGDSQDVAAKLRALLQMSEPDQTLIRAELRRYVEREHGLEKLVDRLIAHV